MDERKKADTRVKEGGRKDRRNGGRKGLSPKGSKDETKWEKEIDGITMQYIKK